MPDIKARQFQLGRRRSTGFLAVPEPSSSPKPVRRAASIASSAPEEVRETESSELYCAVGCGDKRNIDDGRFYHVCERVVSNFHCACILFATGILSIVIPFVQMIESDGYVSPKLEAYFGFYVSLIVLWSAEIAVWCGGRSYYIFTVWPLVDLVCLGSMMIEVPEVLSAAFKLSGISETLIRQYGRMVFPSDYVYVQMLLNLLRIVRLLKVVKHARTMQKCAEEVALRVNAKIIRKTQGAPTDLPVNTTLVTPRQEARSMVVAQRVSSRTYGAVVTSVVILICTIPVLYVIPDDSPSSAALAIDSVQIQMKEYEESCSASAKTGLDHSILDLLSVTSLPNAPLTKAIYFGYLWPEASSAVSAPSALTASAYSMCGTKYVIDQSNIDSYRSLASTRQSALYSQLVPGELSDAAYSRTNTAASWLQGSTCSVQDLRSSYSALSVSPATSYLVALQTVDANQCHSTQLSLSRVRYFFPSITAYNISNQSIPFILIDYSAYLTQVGWLTLGLCAAALFAIFLAHHALFSDVLTLILEPLARLVTKVNQIRRDPLTCANIADDEYRLELSLRSSLAQWAKLPIWRRIFHTILGKAPRRLRECSEVSTMEKSMVKIGSLLVVGYGKAGGRLIAEHISNDSGSNAMHMGKLDMRVFGRKVDAVYVFCSILDFDVLSEVLQDRVMVFTNQVAEVVHGISDEFLGSPAANLGNTLLIVWHRSEKTTNGSSVTSPADLALLCASKVLAALQRSPVMAQYREHPGILAKIPDYRVRVAFGLHAGWGVEGALGSQHKVDTAYLGPHVSIAQSVNGLASGKYHTDILLTESVAQTCSKATLEKLRRVDSIKIPANQNALPMNLYTLDLDLGAISVLSTGPTSSPEKRPSVIIEDPRNTKAATEPSGAKSRAFSKVLTSLRSSTENKGSAPLNSTAPIGKTKTGLALPRLRALVHRRSEASMLVSSLKGAALVKLKLKQDRARRQAEKASSRYSARQAWEGDDDLKAMRARFENPNGLMFRSIFDKAITNYLCGEHDIAIEALQRSRGYWKRRPTSRNQGSGKSGSSSREPSLSASSDEESTPTAGQRTRRSESASHRSSVRFTDDANASSAQTEIVLSRGSRGSSGQSAVPSNLTVNPYSIGDDGPSVSLLQAIAAIFAVAGSAVK